MDLLNVAVHAGAHFDLTIGRDNGGVFAVGFGGVGWDGWGFGLRLSWREEVGAEHSD